MRSRRTRSRRRKSKQLLLITLYDSTHRKHLQVFSTKFALVFSQTRHVVTKRDKKAGPGESANP